MNVNGRHYQNYQSWLSEELRARRLQNTSYSLRSFARYLGVGGSTLSEVLNGKRNLSVRNAKKIAEKLLLSPVEERNLLKEIGAESAKFGQYAEVSKLIPTLTINEYNFRVISDWYHLALIQLAQTSKWDGTVTTAAKFLSIQEIEVKKALSRLEHLGYFRVEGDKYILKEAALIKTTHGVPSAAIRKSHKQHFKLAEKALESVPVELRNMNTLTIAINPSQLHEANNEILKFKQRMREIMQQEQLTEVYTLAIQLFPLTKQIKDIQKP